MKPTLSLSALAIAALASSSSSAFSQFRSEVPNGNVLSCLTCHERAGGGRPWNAFGDAIFLANGGTVDTPASIDAFDDSFIWWDDDLCGADSDGDGQTNGQELGNPGCSWTGGAAARTTDVSAPGNSALTSEDPDGVTGEGEGEGAEGEGEGEGETGGCFSSGEPALLIPILLLLRRRRRR